MTEERYLVRSWGATGAPTWGVEPAGMRGVLVKPNPAGHPMTRLEVFAVPADKATLSIDALILEARRGALMRIFHDPAMCAKAAAFNAGARR